MTVSFTVKNYNVEIKTFNMCVTCDFEKWLKLNAPNLLLFSGGANASSRSGATSKVRFEGKSEISELKGIDIGSVSNELH